MFADLRVDDDPPPALLLRITYEELEPLVSPAPGTPDERLVELLIFAPPLLLLAPLTPFLIELFKSPDLHVSLCLSQ